MKFRLSTVLLLVVMTAVFSSCTREFVCRCTISYSGQPGLPEPVVEEYPVTDTKSKAKSVCEGNSDSLVTGNITTLEKCELY
ncbi:MAG TPA: hypothetical protein VL098_01580 [Flavipsychrobacter sp.]|nr:hypothetical protein [Flavipsychrobacter sp.]